jgi:putative tryptophan/tyrosine transport system substrate-binding protein
VVGYQFPVKAGANTMKSKSFFWLLMTVLLITAPAAEAQQPGKVRRIGFLGTAPTYFVDAFRQGLRDRGWVEGQTITIEYRDAGGKRGQYAHLAAELVRLKVDVIVATSTGPALAAQRATKTVPIVMTVTDPVGSGLVTSLARPGGNITGTTSFSMDLSGKRLELLKEMVPNLSRVAVFWDPESPGNKPQMQGIEVAAQALGLQLQSVELRRPDVDLESAFQSAVKEQAGAVITMSGPSQALSRARVAQLAAKSRLPAIYPEEAFVDAGGLISYGPNRYDTYRRMAIYVDKILKGAKPADLPVEQPTKFELVINLKAAKQIGLTIPPNLLARADRVIK